MWCPCFPPDYFLLPSLQDAKRLQWPTVFRQSFSPLIKIFVFKNLSTIHFSYISMKGSKTFCGLKVRNKTPLWPQPLSLNCFYIVPCACQIPIKVDSRLGIEGIAKLNGWASPVVVTSPFLTSLSNQDWRVNSPLLSVTLGGVLSRPSETQVATRHCIKPR